MFDVTSWINFYGDEQDPIVRVPYFACSYHMMVRYQDRFLASREIANPFQWRGVGFKNNLDV